MSTDVASLLASARALSGLSARQAAILAGVSPSTVTRIERRLLDPSVSVFERILAACGYRYGTDLVPNVDMAAVRAARRILEPELDIPATDGSERFARRWEAAGLIASDSAAEEATELATRAAQQARLSARPGARGFAYRDWRSVARALAATDQDWALTGGYAAALHTSVATVNWAVFYVADVAAAADAAGLEPVEVGRRVSLVPFDEMTSAGVQRLDGGLRVASFWQVVIDCFAGNGRMPAQAEAMIARALAAAAAP